MLECHCGNEPLAPCCPLNPLCPWKQEFQLTSQIRFLFFWFCASVASCQTSAGRRRGLTATGPLSSSVFLSSFFHSLLSLLCLSFSSSPPPPPLNWVVRQAGSSDCGVYVGSPGGRGAPAFVIPKTGQFFTVTTAWVNMAKIRIGGEEELHL